MDETKKESTKKITLWMSIIIGGIVAYIFGYASRMSIENNTTLGASFEIVIKNISSFKLFYLPIGGSVYLSWLGGAAVGLISYFFISLDNEKNAFEKNPGGEGRFMNEKELKEYTDKYQEKDPDPILQNLPIVYDNDKDRYKYSQNMIYSMHWTRPLDARRLIGNNSSLILGGAGSGKTRFFIKPNILQMNASFVITDPAGEIVYELGKTLSDHGYKIKIFNTQDMEHSNCYNPLKYIRNDVGVDMVIDCLINNTTKGSGGGDNQFFVDAEKLLYSACIHYLVDFCQDKTKKNFAGVMDMINSSHVDENNANAKSPLDELFDNLPYDSIARKNYRSFKQAAGKTLKSIIISCVTRLRPFITPQVVNLTRRDDLELEKIGNEKTALFIITPAADRTYSFLAAMLYSQLFETLYYVGDEKEARTGDPRLPIPVRCMMDEFANIGEIPDFPSRLATMRKYDISANVVLQDLSQIESMYKENWRELMGNCSTWLFLGANEQNTLKYFSEQLGKKTVTSKSRGVQSKGSSSKNFSGQSKEVMSINELAILNSDECIVFTQNMRAVKDKKYNYSKHPYYSQTAEANKDQAFNYKELAEYDNSNMEKLENVLVAQQEVAKHNQIKEKSKSKKADSIKKKGNMHIQSGNVDMGESKQEYDMQLMILQDKIFADYESKSPMIVKSIGLKYNIQERIVNELSAVCAINPLIVFSELEEDDTLLGIAVTKEENIDKLYKALNNSIAKKVQKNKTSVYIALVKTNYDEYVNKVKRAYNNI